MLYSWKKEKIIDITSYQHNDNWYISISYLNSHSDYNETDEIGVIADI